MVNSISEMVRESFGYEEMVKYVFGLNSLDLEIHKILLFHSPLKVEGLGEIIKRDKSTVHQSLQRLMACGIAYRKKKSIESGGYYYEYISVNSAKIKQLLKKDVDDWYCKMNELIENKELSDNPVH